MHTVYCMLYVYETGLSDRILKNYVLPTYCVICMCLSGFLQIVSYCSVGVLFRHFHKVLLLFGNKLLNTFMLHYWPIYLIDDHTLF